MRFTLLKLVPLFEAVHSVETRERYLKLARRCMKNAQRLSSQSFSTTLQFNHGQCQYLSDKLREALFKAETSLEWVSSSTIDVISSTLDVIDEQGMEIMKLLWQCAKRLRASFWVVTETTRSKLPLCRQI